MSSAEKIDEAWYKKALKICLLLLADLVVINVVYHIWVAERGTPMLKSIKASVVWPLGLIREKTACRQGVVAGIICDAQTRCAIINGSSVKEGDFINGAEVLSINETDVQFKKNGQVWKQRVGQKPSSAWNND